MAKPSGNDNTCRQLSTAEIIRLLDLKPYPEGGHFRETFRDVRLVEDVRAASLRPHLGTTDERHG